MSSQNCERIYHFSNGDMEERSSGSFYRRIIHVEAGRSYNRM